MDPTNIIKKYIHPQSVLNVKCDDTSVKLEDLKFVTPADIGLLTRVLHSYEEYLETEILNPVNSEAEKDRLEFLDRYLDIPVLALFYMNEIGYGLFSKLIKNGNTGIPKFLFCSDIIDEDFYKNGTTDELDWLSKTGMIMLDEKLTAAFALHGNLECLRHARMLGCPWNDRVTELAAKKGHLECLKYAHLNGCKLNHVIAEAALNGHLECLKYAHMNGSRLTYFPACYAAAGGHLECLKYFVENGCYIDWVCINSAVRNGHLECFKYLYKKFRKMNCYVLDSAVREGHLDCLKYIHEIGYAFDIDECLKFAPENCREYLLDLKTQRPERV